MSEPASSDARAADEASGDRARHTGRPSEIAGRYRIRAKLGDGGMGVVYRADDLAAKRSVALKVLYPHLAVGEAAFERLQREVRAAAQIDHPGVVRVFDAGADGDGTLYLAMELLEGEPVASLMRRSWPGTRRSVELILELLEPLRRAHERGIVHGDLQPENLFLAEDPVTGAVRLKLLDFGLARQLGRDAAGTRAAGTPEYTSPEQARGPSLAATSSDVWSVGVLLYELLSGALPFVGDSPGAILGAVTERPHAPLAARAPHVPRAITEVVERCLVKDVEARIQTAGQLATALAEASAGCELDERRPTELARASRVAESDPPPDLTGIPSTDDLDLARAHDTPPAHSTARVPAPRPRWPLVVIVTAVVLAALGIVLWMVHATPHL